MHELGERVAVATDAVVVDGSKAEALPPSTMVA
jgi:hypothetical protein